MSTNPGSDANCEPAQPAASAPTRELALRADVEQARPERDRHREAREHQRDRRDEGLGDVVRRAEGALEQRGVRGDRIVAAEPDEDRAEEQRDGDGQDGDGGPLRPLERELTHGRGRAFVARPRRRWWLDLGHQVT